VWQLQLYCHVQSRVALALARTRSLSLELSRTRLPGAAKPFSFHSLSSCYSSTESICYIATKFLWKYFDRCRRCDRKRNSKKCLLVAEFNFRFQFLHVHVFRGFSYLSSCKILAKSDYPQLSYCDFTNLWCVRCVGNMFCLLNSSEISFSINIPNDVAPMQVSLENEITLATADSIFSAGSGGRGAFVPKVYPGGALSGCTLISVLVRNFSEIGQSAAEL